MVFETNLWYHLFGRIIYIHIFNFSFDNFTSKTDSTKVAGINNDSKQVDIRNPFYSKRYKIQKRQKKYLALIQ